MARTYLDPHSPYVGYNTVGEQFTTVSNAATQLADGARRDSASGEPQSAARRSGSAEPPGCGNWSAAGTGFGSAQQLVTAGARPEQRCVRPGHPGPTR